MNVRIADAYTNEDIKTYSIDLGNIDHHLLAASIQGCWSLWGLGKYQCKKRVSRLRRNALKGITSMMKSHQ